jgi:hypothetical protein
MRDIATFVGDSGKTVAIIYEGDDGGGVTFYQVNYGAQDSQKAFKVFMTESEATSFAAKYTDAGNKPTFLSE